MFRKVTSMKLTLLAFTSCLVLAVASSSQTLPGARPFTGTITDTMCGAKHTMMKGAPDDQCVTMCVKGSAEYALYDGKDLWKLSDQKAPAKFAAAKVIVMGTADPKTKTIKVVSIAAAP
jgi:hypothetical protein